MKNLQNLKPIVLFAVTFLFLSALTATVKAQHPENTLLWEVSGKMLKKPSYIFGTYHAADKGFIDTMQTVNTKLAAVDAVVGEIVLGVSDSTLNANLPQYMILKGTTLDKLLTAEEYKLVADYLKKAVNYDIRIFNSFTPAAILSMVSQQLAPKTFTKDNPAIDQAFQDYARAHHKPVFGLASPDAQAKVLYSSTLESQKELLLKSAVSWEKLKEQSIKMYRLYISQNLVEMEKMFSTDNGYSQEDIDKLLKNRNLNWLAQLPQLMQNQSLFIAVGAAHLFGNDGLVKGLRAKGYTVKPLHTN